MGERRASRCVGFITGIRRLTVDSSGPSNFYILTSDLSQRTVLLSTTNLFWVYIFEDGVVFTDLLKNLRSFEPQRIRLQWPDPFEQRSLIFRFVAARFDFARRLILETYTTYNI